MSNGAKHWVIIPLLFLPACQKVQIHGTGYGGSDGLWTQLNASRTIVIGKVLGWSLTKSNAVWCKPVSCDTNPYSCQIAKAIQVNETLRAIVTGYLADKKNADRWLERAKESEFEITDDLVKEGVGPVDALTPLTTDGPFTIRFHRARMATKSAAELEFTWAHELAHAVEGKDDKENYHAASFQDVADALSACLNLGPSFPEGTEAPANPPVAQNPPTNPTPPAQNPPVTPPPATNPPVVQNPPPANPAPANPPVVQNPPAPVCTTSVVGTETHTGLKAARADLYTIANLSPSGHQPPKQVLTTVGPIGGKKLVLTSATGVSITRIYPDGGSNINPSHVKDCPVMWMIHFKRANGSVIWAADGAEERLGAYWNGLEIPADAVSAFVGLHAGSSAQYTDNEGNRWTPSSISTGGCTFKFQLEHTACQ